MTGQELDTRENKVLYLQSELDLHIWQQTAALCEQKELLDTTLPSAGDNE